MALNDFQKGRLRRHLHHTSAVIDDNGNEISPGGGGTAATTTFTPTGNIAATDVQAAIVELDTEKQPLDSDLTAIAALSTTSYGRSLLALADAAALRSSAAVGLVLLEQHTASSSASLDFTSCITSTYDEYVIDFVNILPASASVLNLLVSTNGGSTWDNTAGHYTGSHFVWSSAGTAGGGGSAASGVVYPFSGRSMSTALPCSGSLILTNPLGTSAKQVFKGSMLGGDGVTSDVTQTLQVSLAYNQLAAINALRFVMTSGNIASGTIRVFGIAK